ncbi:peptidylprolyl isomerase [Novosphingobium nitrogenifigens DSM 19370]|uniref:Peptidyl-prolyl cis-trans isomerase n=1 Tax=Novosphingobium nitrogenifigens DSM 19370 TaxID=983920 RepID=F1Z8W5_9SPHN|nr:peptidylprolyl isomerase [Novosphingobium nitrogenifigens]EGD58874.1 peptidylprolyl isomerase [Novosphingobium nitrogenifigens DSM 19370]
MRLRVLAALALGASLAATPVLAQQRDPSKEEVKPIKIDRLTASSTIPYAIDADESHDPENVLVLYLSNGGRVAIRLMPQWAPHHVERIKTLARQGFYDGIIFHRVIDGFMAQTGDPTGTGQGGSKLPDLDAEFNDVPHGRGTVSMARTDDPNSANSQFFIVFYPRTALDHKYTNFGRVISGMDAVDRIVRGEPPQHPTKIVQASIAADHKAPPAADAAPVSAAPITSDMLNHSRSQ